MARFRYRAVTPNGTLERGEIEADSIEDALARLHDQGYMPLEVLPVQAWRGGLARWTHPRTLDLAGQAEFALQLGTLLRAGQPLDRALGLLIELPETASARSMIERIRERVRGGAPLSAALDAEPAVFSKLFTSLIRAGEASGHLDTALTGLSTHLARTVALRGTILNALVYPAFLLVGVLGALILLLTYVVPSFVPIFAGMGVPLPWITVGVLALGQFLQQWGWAVLLGLVALGVLAAQRLKDAATRLALDRHLLKMRVLGPLLIKIEMARIARTLGTLTGNGVSLLSAMAIASQVAANRAIRADVEQAAERVRDGHALAAALTHASWAPRVALAMIQVGEESGELDALLLRLADTFEADAGRSIDRLLAALVPTLTVLMTFLVGLIMLAILLPLLSLTSGIH